MVVSPPSLCLAPIVLVSRKSIALHDVWRAIAILLLMAALPVHHSFAQAPPRGARKTDRASTAKPHPAIVQVLARDEEGLARGSGSLVYVDHEYGYVLTNWHVVRSGIEIDVRFPDGFNSTGTTVKMDADWDLALVRIWKPKVDPLLVAGVVPIPGDLLTIAGYGQGTFRAAQGKCIHYAAPDALRPFEMVEVSVEARQGDSGGPILNTRGELAGVLFGAGDGATTGSHIGRVKRFLDETFIEQQRLAQGLDALPALAAPRRQPPPPFVPSQTQVADSNLPMPSPSQQLVEVPRRKDDATADTDSTALSLGPALPPHGPVARLSTPEPFHELTENSESPIAPNDRNKDLPSIDDPHIELPTDVHSAPVLADSESLELPELPMLEPPTSGPNLVAQQPTASSSPVPLPVLSVPAGGPTNQRYRSPAFSLNRSVAQRLFEATKSVLAIIGAIAIVFQFAKASLRKKQA